MLVNYSPEGIRESEARETGKKLSGSSGEWEKDYWYHAGGVL